MIVLEASRGQHLIDKKSEAIKCSDLIIGILFLWLATLFIYKRLNNSQLVLPISLILTVIIYIVWININKETNIISVLVKHRWLIAILVFTICVSLRIHGTSIGVYNELMPTQIEKTKTTFFGEPRVVRTDEYAVQTPTFFSQYYNRFKLYSTQKSLKPLNMLLDYYSPVFDLTMIGKPLAWGYLLFGNEIGLSWYWCSLQILLFMTSFEMFLILLDRRITEAIVGACLIWLSPEVQWWVLPHMPIVIMYAMGLFCIGYYFFTAKSERYRLFSSLLAIVCFVGFSISIFPSYQVPYTYIILILLITCLLRDKERITFNKSNIPILALTIAICIFILGRFILLSKDDISMLLHTSYPGERISTGGTYHIRDLFSDSTSLFLSYYDTLYLNNCEIASYIHIAPFFFAISPLIFYRLGKKKNANLVIGMALACILFFESIFMLAGIPISIAKLTFLKYCNRMGAIYDWTATVFTVWGASILLKYRDVLTAKEKLLLPILYGMASYSLIDESTRNYFGQIVIYGINIGETIVILYCIGIVYIISLIFQNRKFLVSSLLIIVMLFAGATVNPIEHGIDAITNHPLGSKIQEIAQSEPDTPWLRIGIGPLGLNNYICANGGKCLNATNFYPDTEKWKIIDPNGTYEDITNRYLNQYFVFTESENYIELTRPDCAVVHINYETLKQLRIGYILTTQENLEEIDESIQCDVLAKQDGLMICKLSYL